MTQRSVAVIGAGLAGSAMAYFLTQRGWRVDLIDQHDGPACAASALPVGMLSPHHTAQPTPMSALSKAGLPLIKSWLEQVDPSRTGWMETQVSHWPEKRESTTPARVDSALVLPALTLVSSWLQAAQITGLYNARWSVRVAGFIKPDQKTWLLTSDANEEIGRYSRVVICAAYGAHCWMQPLGHDLRAVAGQMTLGPAPQTPPTEHPGKCKGVYVPWFKGANPCSSGFGVDQPVWTAGSTYRRGDATAAVLVSDHMANRAAIERTYPHHLEMFDQCHESGQLSAWTGVRCASVDRMPLVGPVSDDPDQQGLYSLVALGSRGLSVAGICAKALSEWIDLGHVECLPNDLVKTMDPRRFAYKKVLPKGHSQTRKMSPIDINHNSHSGNAV